MKASCLNSGQQSLTKFSAERCHAKRRQLCLGAGKRREASEPSGSGTLSEAAIWVVLWLENPVEMPPERIRLQQ